MGSNKDEESGAIHEKEIIKAARLVKPCMACLCSFLVSMVGGLMLVWWEIEYHPTNCQLWMVPFGLILFATPVIVWFSIFLSDLCNSESDSRGLNEGDNWVHNDLER